MAPKKSQPVNKFLEVDESVAIIIQHVEHLDEGKEEKWTKMLKKSNNWIAVG